VIFTESLRNTRNKTIAIDVDGTLCTEEKTFERPLAKPLPYAQEALALLKKNGNVVILWTSRGWEQYRVTKEWLDKHGFIYDILLMGKPIIDIIVDDRARRFVGWENQDV